MFWNKFNQIFPWTSLSLLWYPENWQFESVYHNLYGNNSIQSITTRQKRTAGMMATMAAAGWWQTNGRVAVDEI